MGVGGDGFEIYDKQLREQFTGDSTASTEAERGQRFGLC